MPGLCLLQPGSTLEEPVSNFTDGPSCRKGARAFVDTNFLP